MEAFFPCAEKVLRGIRTSLPSPARSPPRASSAGAHPTSPHRVSLISPLRRNADITPIADRGEWLRPTIEPDSGDEWLRPTIEPSSRLLHPTHSRTYSIATKRTEIVSPACAPVIRPSLHAGREARRGNARRVTGSTVMGLSNNLDLTFAVPRRSSGGVAFLVAAGDVGGHLAAPRRASSASRRRSIA